jgi:hypothetical protein
MRDDAQAAMDAITAGVAQRVGPQAFATMLAALATPWSAD